MVDRIKIFIGYEYIESKQQNMKTFSSIVEGYCEQNSKRYKASNGKIYKNTFWEPLGGIKILDKGLGGGHRYCQALAGYIYKEVK